MLRKIRFALSAPVSGASPDGRLVLSHVRANMPSLSQEQPRDVGSVKVISCIAANLGGLYSLHVSGCSGRITGRKASKQGTCTGSGQVKLFGDSHLRLQHSRISTQIFGTFWIQSICLSDWDSLREHIHFSR